MGRWRQVGGTPTTGQVKHEEVINNNLAVTCLDEAASDEEVIVPIYEWVNEEENTSSGYGSNQWFSWHEIDVDAITARL